MDKMNTLELGRIGLLAACCLSLVACTQGKGEACQNSGDCDDGLVCKRDDGSRGQCADPDDVDESVDGGAVPNPDLPDDVLDAAIDAGPDAATDAGLDAASEVDAGGMDEDAGGLDEE